MTVEYLSAGAPSRPRLRRAVAVILVMLLVVSGSAAWWNHKVRSEANVALSGALAAAEREAATGEDYVVSTLSYAYPMIWSTMVPGDVRAGLRRLVEASAAKVVTSLSIARAEASEARILPWQTAQRDARDAVLAQVDAHLARFARIATDARTIGQVLAEPAPSKDEAVNLLRASGAEDPAIR